VNRTGSGRSEPRGRIVTHDDATPDPEKSGAGAAFFSSLLERFEEKIEALVARGRYVVAEIDGNTVGHAFLEPLGNLAATSHVFVLTIVVHPGMLGRGIGSALLGNLLEWATQDARVMKVELRVRSTNTRAIALYRKLGFVEEGRFRRRLRLEDGTFIDDLAMAWFPGSS
jgi:ribosomal protein S18 acetylase RimI-like enzyme